MARREVIALGVLGWFFFAKAGSGPVMRYDFVEQSICERARTEIRRFDGVRTTDCLYDGRA